MAEAARHKERVAIDAREGYRGRFDEEWRRDDNLGADNRCTCEGQRDTDVSQPAPEEPLTPEGEEERDADDRGR